MMADEGGLFGSLMGSPWSRLLPGDDVEDDNCKMPPPKGRAPVRSPCDVMRLPVRDMHELGHWPETDTFCTVECELCGRLMVPHALSRHMQENHVDALDMLRAKMNKPRIVISKKITNSPPPPSSVPTTIVAAADDNETEPTTVYCSLCSTAVASASFRRHAIKTHGDINSAKPLKNKTAAVKPSPPKKNNITTNSKSASPIEQTDELSKEVTKKLPKSKKKSSSIVSLSTTTTTLTTSVAVVPPIESDTKKSNKKKKVIVNGEYDPCNHCGVVNDDGNPCLRNIVCRLHPVALRRLVNRPFPYDVLAKVTKTQIDEKLKNETPSTTTTTTTVTTPETVTETPPVKRIKTEIIVEEEEYVIEDASNENTESAVERPRPLLCWGLEAPVSPPIPPPPPFVLADLPWHGTLQQLRPLATNTFGCRIVGGLMTPYKRWDPVRKHLQAVLAQDANSANAKTAKVLAAKKQAQAAVARRKRKSSGSSNSSDNVLNGLLQPSNGVNSVPLRLFNGNQSTFIQVNLCPSK